MDRIDGYQGLTPFYGDLHSHCAIGYGHGSAEDAFRNARLQLDFACVTAHALWPDMPLRDVRLESTVDYHRKGFKRTQEEWDHFQRVVEAFNEPNKFITFLGYEWHSLQYGDHHICLNGSHGEILRADTIEGIRKELRRLSSQGGGGILVPHHIGYKSGYRGINWATFDPELSPVVEIMSMHGVSESDQAPYPFLHTMGPRDWGSTLQYGLGQGNVVGVVGSTDHHSAHPGSYGHGRMGVWARSLTRAGIWEAILSRRTYALTGDRMVLAFALNQQTMGTILPSSSERQIEVFVEGGDSVDEIEIIYNNRLLQTWKGETSTSELDEGHADRFKVYLEVGWGEKNQDVEWDVTLEVEDGQLISIEPRFRGQEILAPQASEEEAYHFSRWEKVEDSGVWFRTRTWGNPTTTTASTQGMSIEVQGSTGTRLLARINDQVVELSLGELIQGARAGYLGGFLTPAYCFHRAVPIGEYRRHVKTKHHVDSLSRDFYYVRVRQKNNQYAWSSPIWVEPEQA